MVENHRKELTMPSITKSSEHDFLGHWRNPALFSYTTEPALLLRQIHDYEKQRAKQPGLGFVLLYSTLMQREIECVLEAEDKVEAARSLIASKVNRFS